MFFSVDDVLQAWTNLSSNVLAITGTNKFQGNLDHSFITPTIIGKLALAEPCSFFIVVLNTLAHPHIFTTTHRRGCTITY